MSAGRDPAVAAAQRFAPKATGLLRDREWTRRAKRGCEQSQQMGWLFDQPQSGYKAEPT
jgi:hypothetical protein